MPGNDENPRPVRINDRTCIDLGFPDYGFHLCSYGYPFPAAWLGMCLILGDSVEVRMMLEMLSGVLDLQALELCHSFLILHLWFAHPFAL